MIRDGTSADVARIVTWSVLALFCGLHWAGQVRPVAVVAAVAAVLGGVVLAVSLLAAHRHGGARVRRVSLPAAALAVVLLGAVCSGIELRLLLPDRWGELVSGVGQGLDSLPDVRIPYPGTDEWVRAVIVLGGALIVGASAVAAFAGRRGGARAPVVSAALLGVLYAVPVVEEPPSSPFLSGALLAVLLVAFLWADRLRLGQLRIAGGLAGAGVLLALAVSPQIDRAEPLIDYEQIVADNLQSASSTEFDWSHDYGPLEWPRDGREVLRVKARRSAYWKATVLSDFDGTAWVQGRRNPPGVPDTEFTPDRRARDRLEVVVRNLESSDYIAAGTTVAVRDSPRLVRDGGSGTFRTGSRPLRKGDSYRAEVYVPRPGSSRLREAGTDYPATMQPYMTMRLPEGRGRLEVLFPFWDDDAPTYAFYGQGGFTDERGEELVGVSPYARVYALARRLRAESTDPYDFARRVRARVQRGATYTESPAPRRHPLDAFLFDTREGYCQQFSGAMTLLLRMGGVPARVAAGFTSGTYDEKREEWVVRDVDAHAWVEAYFPGEGWVAFDPTPEVAPPRSQLPDPQEEDETAADEEEASDAEAEDAAQTPDEADPAAAAGDDAGSGGHGTSWALLLALAAAIACLAVLVVGRRARRGVRTVEAEVEELRRALRRAGREPAPGATLSELERELGDGGYLAALRAARYAAPEGAMPGPTAAQRRALRRALAAGGGLRARVRSWWALPPRARAG